MQCDTCWLSKSERFAIVSDSLQIKIVCLTYKWRNKAPKEKEK